MNHMWIKLIFLIFLIFLTGCNKCDITDLESVGKILDATVISTSFNQSSRTQVKTEKYFAIVRGSPGLFLHEDAQIGTDCKGRKYLCQRGTCVVLFRKKIKKIN